MTETNWMGLDRSRKMSFSAREREEGMQCCVWPSCMVRSFALGTEINAMAVMR